MLRRSFLVAAPAAAAALAARPPLLHAAPAGPPAPPSPPAWDYSQAAGPLHWGDAYPACGRGRVQAPINLTPPFRTRGGGGGGGRGGEASPAVSAAYVAAPFVARDVGTTVRWEVGVAGAGGRITALDADAAAAGAPAGGLVVGPALWPLVQLHFHAPGEEAVGGHRAPLGVHLVHARPQGSRWTPAAAAAAAALGDSRDAPTAIVATALFEVGGGGGRGGGGGGGGAPHPAVAELFSCLPGILRVGGGARSAATTAAASSALPAFNAGTLLPLAGSSSSADGGGGGRGLLIAGGAWAYAGSLTTPPCGEGVTFVVARARGRILADQAAALRRAGFPPNARPLQARHGRPIIVI